MATHQQIRSIPPVNREVWAFSLGGLVRHPLSLSFADLAALPTVTQTVSVICTTRQSIDTAEYTGVPVSALLDLVEIDPGAQAALLHGYDGYSATLTLQELRDRAVIAYAVNGQPLTHDQGYPARLVIPGKYGFKLPKWVTRIEIDQQYRCGTWEGKPGFDPYNGLHAGELVVAITGHERLASGALRLSGFVYSLADSPLELTLSIDGFAVRLDYMPGQYAWHYDWLPPYANGVFSASVNAFNPLTQASSSFRDYPIRS